MGKKMINIRLEDSVWKKAKLDAVAHDMTLQDWLTHLILGNSTTQQPIDNSLPYEGRLIPVDPGSS